MKTESFVLPLFPLLRLLSHASHACSSSVSLSCPWISSATWRWHLVLRPLLLLLLLDFHFSLCGVCSMPSRWKNALLMMIIIVFWHYGLRKTKKHEKKSWNVLLNVVQIALEMLCFFFVFCFNESTNLSDGPFYSSHWQMGIKRPANHFKWQKNVDRMKPFVSVPSSSGDLNVEKKQKKRNHKFSQSKKSSLEEWGSVRVNILLWIDW